MSNVAAFQGFLSEHYDAAILDKADDGSPMYYINPNTPPYIFKYGDFQGAVNDHGTGKIAQSTGLNITRLDHTATLFNNTYWNGTLYLDFENNLSPLFIRVKEWRLYDAYFQFMTTTSPYNTPSFKIGWILSSAKKLFQAGTYFGGKLEMGFFKDGLLGDIMPFGIQKAPEWLMTLQWKLYFSILISMNGQGQILPDAFNYKEVFTRDAVGALIGYLYTSDARSRQFVLNVLDEIKKRQTAEGAIPTSFTSYVNWKRVTYTSALDVQAWYAILAWQYYLVTQDQGFLDDYATSLRLAIDVLLKNDTDGNYLINAFPDNASDWADTIKREGEPLFLNSLTCWALRHMAELELTFNNATGHNFYSEWAENIRFGLNRDFADGGLWNSTGGYYSAWRFENGTVRSYFEVDSNLLAVFSGVASKSRAESVFRFIDAHQELEGNAPSRVLLGLYDPRDILVPSWASPDNYQNGGNWLWIGGYDILTRTAFNQTTKALNLVKRIRGAVFRNSSVYEWYDSQGFGRWNQSKCEWFSWSAGTVLYSIFRGLLGIEMESNGLRVRGELPAGLGNVTVRLLFRQTNFTISYYGYGSYVSRMIVDGELVNSLVIPLEYYDEGTHVVDVYLSESPPRDHVYLQSTVLPVASVTFSDDNRLNITFAPANFTDEVKLYVPWEDFYVVVRFENGTFRNWQKVGYAAKFVLNPLEVRSIEFMHGHLLSEDLVFWMSTDVSIADLSFEDSESLTVHFEVHSEAFTRLVVYAPEYGEPSRISVGGNLFLWRCKDVETFRAANDDCWFLNEADNTVHIKTIYFGLTSIAVQWGFAFPELIPMFWTVTYSMVIAGVFAIMAALFVLWCLRRKRRGMIGRRRLQVSNRG